MASAGSYPKARVILGFVVAPALTGLTIVLCDLLFTLVSAGPLREGEFYYTFGLLFMVFGLLYYGLPAGLIGVACAVLQLRRTLCVLFGLALTGAIVGNLWGQLLASLIDTDKAIPTLPVLASATPTVLGACAALTMALLLLPPALRTPADTAAPPPDARG